jgi:NTP pyrophosphatase (non-canonical NTP hydrolase)
MDYFELECAVETWAEEKGILSKATPMAQALKTLEETTELCTAINSNDRAEIIDAMGDIMVTLIIQAKMQGLKLEECLESAYNVISKRTGKMVNGVFVKDIEVNIPSVWDDTLQDGLEDEPDWEITNNIEVNDPEEINMKDIDIISGTEMAYIKKINHDK